MRHLRALVTGASEGIGRATAQLLAAQGHQITAVARNGARLETLLNALPSVATGAHRALQADLTESAELAQVEADLGEVPYDVVVNNAGMGQFGAFTDISPAQHQQVMRLNLDALVSLAHTYLKNARGGDALVNVSSTLAFLPMPAAAVYAASKAFVTSLSESLWFEQRLRGVYVVNVCPGITSTEFASRSGQNRLQGTIPGFMVQTPEQVAQRTWEALQARAQPTVVCGQVNVAGTQLIRLLPRRAVVRLMGSAQPRD